MVNIIILVLHFLGGHLISSTRANAEKDVSLQFNEFAFDIRKEMNRRSDNDASNFVFSPFSISSAFAMLGAGAEGATKKEMVSAFRWGNFESMLSESMQPMLQRISQLKENSSYLNIANKIWVEEDFAILESFRRKVIQIFDAEIGKEDFKTDPEKSREQINGWVASKTKDKIKDLFPAGSLTRQTKLVLANAIYFKGKWEHPFDENETKERKFYPSRGESVKVDFMTKEGYYAAHVDADRNVQIVELPYTGRNFSLFIVKPRAFNIRDVETEINAQVFNQWISANAGRGQTVKLSVPKFKILHTMSSVSRYLQAMNINDLFDPARANLSGISGNTDLFCSRAIHKAFIQVDEEGTEAAAATGISVGITSVHLPPPELIIDQPFLFYIVEKKTNVILFAGKVVSPTFGNATQLGKSRNSAKTFATDSLVILFTSFITYLYLWTTV